MVRECSRATIVSLAFPLASKSSLNALASLIVAACSTGVSRPSGWSILASPLPSSSSLRAPHLPLLTAAKTAL